MTRRDSKGPFATSEGSYRLSGADGDERGAGAGSPATAAASEVHAGDGAAARPNTGADSQVDTQPNPQEAARLDSRPGSQVDTQPNEQAAAQPDTQPNEQAAAQPDTRPNERRVPGPGPKSSDDNNEPPLDDLNEAFARAAEVVRERERRGRSPAAPVPAALAALAAIAEEDSVPVFEDSRPLTDAPAAAVAERSSDPGGSNKALQSRPATADVGGRPGSGASLPDASRPRGARADKAAPDRATPRDAAPDKAAPRDAAPDKAAPRDAAPDKAAPRRAAPDKAAEQATPGRAAAGHATSEKAAAGLAGVDRVAAEREHVETRSAAPHADASATAEAAPPGATPTPEGAPPPRPATEPHEGDRAARAALHQRRRQTTGTPSTSESPAVAPSRRPRRATNPPTPDERAADALAVHRRRRTPRYRSLLWRWWSSWFRRPKPAVAAPLPAVEPGQMSVSFAGHASALVRYHNLSIACDPMLGSWYKGIRRRQQPGLSPAEFSDVELILLSHADPAHMHRDTLAKLPRSATIVLPPCTAQFVSDLGFARVIELGIGQSLQLRQVNIRTTAARHAGRRGSKALSYVVRGEGPSVFFCGDSGYFSGFAEIGRRYQPDVALLPISGYAPRSFRERHMSPLDALNAFEDLQARALVPIRFGAFPLSYEQLHDPARWLAELIRERDLDPFVAPLEPGASRIFTLPPGERSRSPRATPRSHTQA